MREKSGFTLAEAAIALSLLVAGVIMSATLFQSVLGHQRRVETRLQAAVLARGALLRARDWLKSPSHFQNPSGFPQASQTVEGFEIQVSFEGMTTQSPNQSFEAGFTQTRTMASSYLKTHVVVKKGDMEFPTTTVIGAPRRTLGSEPVKLELASGGNVGTSLEADQKIELQAKLLDSSGREIPDVFFQWSVRPINGVASLSDISRDGRTAALANRAKKRDGNWTQTGGRCLVGAGTAYGGQETWTFSAPILLQEPTP